MRALNLREHVETLRLQGNEWADDILMLVDLEEEVAEPYSELCDAVGHYAPEGLRDKPVKAAEWLGDRSELLEEIEKQFEDANRNKTGTDDVADMVKELLGTLEQAEDILSAAGFEEGELLDRLQELADLAETAPTPKEYDL